MIAVLAHMVASGQMIMPNSSRGGSLEERDAVNHPRKFDQDRIVAARIRRARRAKRRQC